ncbi:ATPase, T2SS/T4P/T4SS family [Bordetella avium]|uniref:ATPase, T2SS/T4P/T4SS family n=2 Tax=Bordetella avium TaxID=521 RepID=UPI000E0C62B3|nr:ATPase, T2SS/T4P/T4SS family [Bordetella avium]RIQ11969.1 FHA domain-containing protein [Bordetella avium]RIQ37069.1 FHA domain-containing protein [Bordetella avium]RIQ39394.1 FHA domain-containing protein [Bordetella avium]RIQ40840.1 FHA domain-containing protein [Bordetella avium]RIQ47322.1 FHA domain-containing protein [Bordetella avium]
MLELTLHYEDGRKQTLKLSAPVLVGRGPHCGVRIANWRVAREHARLRLGAEGWLIEDLGGLGGTYVNGARVVLHGPLSASDDIVIGPCRLQLHLKPSAGAVLPDIRPVCDAALLSCRVALHEALIQVLDLRRRDVAAMSDAMLRQEAAELLGRLLQEGGLDVPDSVNREQLCQSVLDEAVGLGALEPLLEDAAVTEIMVNGPDRIYVECDGRLQRHDGSFSSEQALRHVLERIVAPLGRRIDEAAPMVDARLAGGARVNAVIPPIATRGTCLTIRKFPHRRLSMSDLLQAQALSAGMAAYLEHAVVQRRNIVVSGGTGAGKTTLLNVLSSAIPEHERIITIEDAAELRLSHEHLVALEARPANMEGRGSVEIRDLVRNALRMRPDRIVVGECRGKEAFDMLTAMNTGHEGSLTTLHANSPRDALGRLESMVLMAGLDLPMPAIREYLASCIDLIVQQARGTDGVRRVVAISEVCGIESGTIQLQELFRYEPQRGFMAAEWQAWQEEGA